MQPLNAPQQHYLEHDRMNWAARKTAHVGDLMVMYRCAPEKCIREIFVLGTKLQRRRTNPIWRDGFALGGEFKIVCRLGAPVFLEDLRDHRMLRTAGFIRGALRGNQDVTAWWPHLYELIVTRNPRSRKPLQRYSPLRLDIR